MLARHACILSIFRAQCKDVHPQLAVTGAPRRVGGRAATESPHARRASKRERSAGVALRAPKRAHRGWRPSVPPGGALVDRSSSSKGCHSTRVFGGVGLVTGVPSPP